MEKPTIYRLDHLGVIAGVIRDLKIIEMLDNHIGIDDQEHISCGESVAGMILNGLGFSQRPMSLTPQFFENKPLFHLFGRPMEAEYFNRFKLGRSLDEIYAYGCDGLFSQLSKQICQQEGIDVKYNHLDTTSFSVTGEYLADSDEHAIQLTHGYSKDHRPDLKQAVLELMVSSDEGVPLLSQSFDGNTTDNEVFKQRSRVLIEEFKASPTPRYLVMDSKGYSESNASNLKELPYIVSIPMTLKLAQQLIEQAVEQADWQKLDETNEYQFFDLCHYQIAQRWVVVSSQSASQQASKTIEKQVKKEKNKLHRQLFHLQAKRFNCQEDAQKALQSILQKMKYHQLHSSEWTEHKQYSSKGRPTEKTKPQKVLWQIQAEVTINTQVVEKNKQMKSCYIIAASLEHIPLSAQEVVIAYKKQLHVERGFRFLKDPVFFVSSLFLKKPQRIEALLMVMTLALMVYSIAQRRMRKSLKDKNMTLPNQIRKPTQTPTLRWICQCLEGIHLIRIQNQGIPQFYIDAMNPNRQIMVSLFGDTVKNIYHYF